MATQGSQQEVQLQGAGPWSTMGYRNGMDVDSDNYRPGSDGYFPSLEVQTGQTLSDAYGPVDSFDPVADASRLRLSRGSENPQLLELESRIRRLNTIGDETRALGNGLRAAGQSAGFSDPSFSLAEERRFSNYPAADTSPFSDVEMASMRAENIARAQTIAAQSATFDSGFRVDIEISRAELAQNAATSALNPAMGSGSIRPIGELDGFFTFDPLGRGMKGAGTAAVDAVTAIPNALRGLGTLAGDAYGYASQASAPQRSVLTGQAFDYQPNSALLQSIRQQGMLGTLGTGITGVVRNAPGIGLIGALGAPNRDWGNVGAQAFNTGAVGVGMVRGAAAGTMNPSTSIGRMAELQTKWGSLSAAERSVLLQSKAEANAYRRLSEMKAATPGAHYLEKHGAQLGLQSQFDRAAYGRNPTTGAPGHAPPAATRFLSHRDQLAVIDRAERIYESTGSIRLAQKPIVFQSATGSGFQSGTLNYGVQYSGQAYINQSTGRAITAFPVWGQ